MGRPCRLAPGHEGFWVATGAFGLLSIVAFLARWLLRARGAPGGGEQGGGRCAGPKWRERQQGESLYGPLLEVAGDDGGRETVPGADVSPARWHVAEEESARGVGEGLSALRRRLERRVDGWVRFAAAAEALYAVLLLLLAGVFALHVVALRFSWLAELVLLLCMLGAKVSVAIALALVHRHLSAAARTAAGVWLLVRICELPRVVGTAIPFWRPFPTHLRCHTAGDTLSHAQVLAGSKLATACFALSFLSPLLFLTSIDHDHLTVSDLCTAVELARCGTCWGLPCCSSAANVYRAGIESACVRGQAGQARRCRSQNDDPRRLRVPCPSIFPLHGRLRKCAASRPEASCLCRWLAAARCLCCSFASAAPSSE